jgi:hypothetical protein
MAYDIYLLNPYEIYQTEETVPEKLPLLKETILRKGAWTVPVTIEKETFVLMDGHHRLETAKSLNLMYIPVVLLNYDEVKVESRRPDLKVTPEDIIRRGLSGDLYPAKSTRHIFPQEYECFIPLDDLRLAIVA